MATITATAQKHELHSEEDLIKYSEILHAKPLWKQMTRLNPPQPNPTCVPHLWSYAKIRPSLLRAGTLISEKQAERRVLMLVNPARGTVELDPPIRVYHPD